MSASTREWLRSGADKSARRAFPMLGHRRHLAPVVRQTACMGSGMDTRGFANPLAPPGFQGSEDSASQACVRLDGRPWHCRRPFEVGSSICALSIVSDRDTRGSRTQVSKSLQGPQA